MQKGKQGMVRKAALCAASLLAVAQTIGAAVVDFNTFAPYQYNRPSGFTQLAQWNVDGADPSTVRQPPTQNPTASVFVSPTLGVNTRFTGSFVNSGPDDDYIGFVLGFSPGDQTNGAADYLLIDWRSTPQNNDFGGGGVGGAEIHGATTPSGNNDVGLALSRVTGRPTADEFWHHYDDPAVMTDAGAVDELARGINEGSRTYGLGAGDTHVMQVDWRSDSVRVFVDGTLEIDYSGPFVPTSGQFGLYQMFQQGFEFNNFSYDPLPPLATPVPEPGFVVALAVLIGAATASARRRRRSLPPLPR